MYQRSLGLFDITHDQFRRPFVLNCHVHFLSFQVCISLVLFIVLSSWNRILVFQIQWFTAVRINIKFLQNVLCHFTLRISPSRSLLALHCPIQFFFGIFAKTVICYNFQFSFVIFQLFSLTPQIHFQISLPQIIHSKFVFLHSIQGGEKGRSVIDVLADIQRIQRWFTFVIVPRSMFIFSHFYGLQSWSTWMIESIFLVMLMPIFWNSYVQGLLFHGLIFLKPSGTEERQRLGWIVAVTECNFGIDEHFEL